MWLGVVVCICSLMLEAFKPSTALRCETAVDLLTVVFSMSVISVYSDPPICMWILILSIRCATVWAQHMC